jgi:hypothetical protein
MNFKGWLNWEESHSVVDIKLPTDYGKYSTPFDEILKVGYSLTTPASILLSRGPDITSNPIHLADIRSSKYLAVHRLLW